MTKISYDAQSRAGKVINTSRARVDCLHSSQSGYFDIPCSQTTGARVRARKRRESIFRLGKIWQTKLVAARRRYYRGTETLLTFFSPNEIKG